MSPSCLILPLLLFGLAAPLPLGGAVLPAAAQEEGEGWDASSDSAEAPSSPAAEAAPGPDISTLDTGEPNPHQTVHAYHGDQR